jgi:DNA-binding NtrC family response regulator
LNRLAFGLYPEKKGCSNGGCAMKKKLEILILDDESIVCERLKAALQKDGFDVETFIEPEKALMRLSEKPFDIVVTDIRMDSMDGLQILEHVSKIFTSVKVIMITGFATMEVARESLAKGAFDFIAKPFKIKEIRATIAKAAEEIEHDRQT